ncbi:hypothetical protein Tco_1329189 [Tanacetum coccineum]
MVNGGEGGGEVNGDRRRRFVVIWEVNGGRFGEEGDLEMYVQEEGEDRGKKIPSKHLDLTFKHFSLPEDV